MKIAICDDEKDVARDLSQRIQKIMSNNSMAGEISCYESAEKLLSEIEKIQIVFLDIDMGKIDGIKVGAEIKKSNPLCQVIMETGVDSRVREAFLIGAIRSLSKPFVDADIEEALQETMSRFVGIEWIEVFLNRTLYKIQQKQISYIRAINSQVEIYANGRVYRKAESMTQILLELDSRMFCRINRSYIINLGKIDTSDMENITIGEKRFRVSRDRKQECRHKIMEYEMKYKRKG